MAIRIKSRWHHSDRNESRYRTFADSAGALAFIIWRLSVEHAREIHREGFDYASDHERIRVISEYCAFAVQLVDRLAHRRVDDEGRAALIVALGRRLADQMQDNLLDIAGPGEYRAPFVEMLNERLDDYARFDFDDNAPGFEALRYLGDRIMRSMGVSQTNRWVMDHVMEISAPELFEKIAKSVDGLLATAA
ncbi:MAG: hypothetical protein OXC65_01105 [Thiotrichales bacterium]|nr:hypothetical protein [Thiotrichales bacterium]